MGELITTERRKKVILVIVDLFICKRANVNEVKRYLESYFIEVDKPKRMFTDNATYFRNNRFKSFCKKNIILTKDIPILIQ